MKVETEIVHIVAFMDASQMAVRHLVAAIELCEWCGPFRDAARPAPSAAPREGEPNHRLRWAIDRLERLHRRVDGSVDDFCSADDQAWPCDTVVAVAAARE